MRNITKDEIADSHILQSLYMKDIFWGKRGDKIQFIN